MAPAAPPRRPVLCARAREPPGRSPQGCPGLQVPPTRGPGEPCAAPSPQPDSRYQAAPRARETAPSLCPTQTFPMFLGRSVLQIVPKKNFMVRQPLEKMSYRMCHSRKRKKSAEETTKSIIKAILLPLLPAYRTTQRLKIQLPWSYPVRV
ncbi:death-associated protein-like 1 isoform X4 [Canis lupus familiaris]|uniref:death-associated protein-like 1 isoform X4 n=1 Tax=Canis lupus familiaris TaxID=9615 RepID=UPI0018F7D478|nr:death-associated protein-like 1 isoform X4 [Canis lupus familiaris]